MSQKIKDEVCKINDYYDYDSEYKNMIIFGSLFNVIFIMLDKLSKEKENYIKNRSEKNKQRITEIINYIDAHYQEEISLKDISEYFLISSGHLSKLFRDNLNITVKGYIMSTRLKHVKEDLIDTDLPLIDIAISNGFPNLKSLNHIFKKDSGITAGQYRRKLKNKNIE